MDRRRSSSPVYGRVGSCERSEIAETCRTGEFTLPPQCSLRLAFGPPSKSGRQDDGESEHETCELRERRAGKHRHCGGRCADRFRPRRARSAERHARPHPHVAGCRANRAGVATAGAGRCAAEQRAAARAGAAAAEDSRHRPQLRRSYCGSRPREAADSRPGSPKCRAQ